MGVDTDDPERAWPSTTWRPGGGCCRPAWSWPRASARGPGARRRRRPGRGLGRAGGRRRAAAATRSTTGSSRGRSTGRGSARRRSRRRPTCRSATTGCTPAARDTETTAAPDRHSRLAGPARAGPSRPVLGLRDPALQRPLARLVGDRRPRRPHRPRGVVGAPSSAPTTCWSTRCTPPSRWHRWSRRRTSRRRGRFFNPLYLRVERIPEYAALPPAERAAVDGLVGAAAAVAGPDRPRRPRRRLDRQASRAPDRPRRAAQRGSRARLRGLPRARGRRAAGVRDLERPRRGPRQRRPRCGRRSSGTRAARRSAPSRTSTPSASTSSAGSSGSSTSSCSRPRPRPPAPGCGSASCTTSPSACTPAAPTRGGCRDVYAQGVRVGAPPDPYNQLGQDWSQPPWRPDRLAELGYQPFRDLIGAVLRHAGGVRVDHVIGLFRLWWIPAGRPASEGTYVRYDHEALIGVLALEAHRAGAVVVGEDLGVVAPEARDFLRARGILGTSILWFERGPDGGPLPAEQWREWCLASVTTHDLPPTSGLPRRRPGPAPAPARPPRGRPRRGARVRHGRGRRLARGAAPPRPARRRRDGHRRRGPALHRYLALTPARLLCVALTDAVGDRRTQNQPGTTDEYPNWRVPLAGPDGRPLPLEEVFTSDRAAELAETVRAVTRRG